MPGGVAGESPIMETPYADCVGFVTVMWFCSIELFCGNLY